MSTDSEAQSKSKYAYKLSVPSRDSTKPSFEEPTEAEIRGYIFEILGVKNEKKREPDELQR